MLNPLGTINIKHRLRWLVLVWMLVFVCSQALASGHDHVDSAHDAPCVMCDYSHDTPIVSVGALHEILANSGCHRSFVIPSEVLTDVLFAYLTRAPPQA